MLVAAPSSLVRQWVVLTSLPRAPQRIDTRTLELRLRSRGIVVNRRTLQRDLVELGTLFPIVADDRSRPYSWWWGDVREPSAVLPPLLPRDAPAIALRLRVDATHLAAVSALVGEAATVACGEVRVTVPDTLELRRALFFLADGVEVLSPVRLRRELTEHAARVCQRYR